MVMPRICSRPGCTGPGEIDVGDNGQTCWLCADHRPMLSAAEPAGETTVGQVLARLRDELRAANGKIDGLVAAAKLAWIEKERLEEDIEQKLLVIQGHEREIALQNEVIGELRRKVGDLSLLLREDAEETLRACQVFFTPLAKRSLTWGEYEQDAERRVRELLAKISQLGQ